MNIYKTKISKEEEIIIDLNKVDCIELVSEVSSFNPFYYINIYINGNKITLNRYSLNEELKAKSDYDDIINQWKSKKGA